MRLVGGLLLVLLFLALVAPRFLVFLFSWLF